MKRLLLLTVLCVTTAFLGFGAALDITIHDTTPPTILLSSVLDQWGVFDSTGTDFTATTNFNTSGTTLFGALSAKDDEGAISSIQIYAFGFVGSSSLNASCTPGSGFSGEWGCTAPTTNPPLNTNLTSPIEWNFTADAAGDDINMNDLFRVVDTSGAATGSKLIWDVEINGNAPPSPTPEPSTVIPAGAAFLAMGLLVVFRRKKALEPSN